jgi:hypothetical protein
MTTGTDLVLQAISLFVIQVGLLVLTAGVVFFIVIRLNARRDE